MGRQNVVVALASLVAALAGWECLCRLLQVPHYVLPPPSMVFTTLVGDWPILGFSLGVTLSTTVKALLAASLGGIALGVALDASRLMKAALSPFMVILQVTPIIAIAPLMLIYLDTNEAVLLCAFLVAFFPMLSGTLVGLKSADHNLHDLFTLQRATGWQRLWHLKLPAALPYILSGLQVAGGLSLIGAIVGEFAAGTAGKGSGLAFRILESQSRLNIPRLFAALVLISVAGVVLYAATNIIAHLMLRNWHESARKKER